MEKIDIFKNLCIRNKKNPNCLLDPDDDYYDDIEVKCTCDNCYFGRTDLAEVAIKLLGTVENLLQNSDIDNQEIGGSQ